jgi:hypothetical protein
MQRRLFGYALMVLAFSVSPFLESGLSADSNHFRAGAARVDITPAENSALLMAGYAARKEGFKGIHDRLYVRAIVFENETAKGAIVTYDLIATRTDLWERVSQRVSSEFGIPRENLLLAGTHTHGAPNIGEEDIEESVGDQKQVAYREKVEESIIEALRLARSNLQPAWVGFGEGAADVNVNRVARISGGRWWLGVNPEGPSDKTVAVVKIANQSGEPIAIFANYAVHGTGMGQDNYLITADIPGATSRFVERHYKDNVVALWTSGAGGNQCPIYNVEAKSFEGVETIGMLLGEEIIRVAENTNAWPNAAISGAQRVVTCAGRKRVGDQLNRKDPDYQFDDADPVPIRLSLLRIGKIALAGVSGEVFTEIAQRLKKESPFARTVMVTHGNGSSGYIPTDEAYKRVSYEIQVSNLKPGCAETAVISGLLDMMGEP